MSLINQMLRDLDCQRGAVNTVRVTTLRGLGPVRRPPAGSRQRRRRCAAGLAVIAVMAGVFLAGREQPGPEIKAGAEVHDSHTRVVALALPPQQHAQRNVRRPQVVSDDTEIKPVNRDKDHTESLDAQAIAAVEVQPPQATPPAAIAAITAAATVKPVLNPQQKAARLFDQAQQALARQQDQVAGTLLEQVLNIDPGNSHARRQLAWLMIAQQRADTAEALLFAGLQQTPLDTDMTRAYAQLLAQRNALLPALDALESVTAAASADAQSQALKAEILSRLQRFPEAIHYYRQALQQQPEQAVWWTGLAVALEHAAQPAAALNAYTQAARGPLQDTVRTFVQQRIQALSAPVAHHNG